MKTLLTIAFMLSVAFVWADEKKDELKIGDKAVLTNVELLDVSGEKVTLDDMKKENGLLVLFSCNTCPFVMQWEGRFPEIKKWADKNEVGMVVLNSNYQNRDGADSYEAMKKKAADKGYNFHYVVDKDSKIANAYGGKTTPHAFLFNEDMVLVYKGAVDDNYKNADNVKQAYLKDAIKSLSAGKDIAISETEPVGCSIKRKIK